MNKIKTVCAVNKCAGCGACIDICPQNCIKLNDSMEYYNAVIDTEKCVNCNLCKSICQAIEHKPLLKQISWHQGWAEDPIVRSKGSSGGVAYAIEKSFIEQGGIVASCVFKSGRFTFECIDDVNRVIEFTGSKYVKSDPTGIYKNIKNWLSKNKPVLFVGLPCQVAAVKNFINDDLQEKLYTIDLICHGTPSPLLLNMYLEQYGVYLSRLNNISFRNKTKYSVSNDGVYFEGNVCDHYSTAFLNSLCNTSNCYECSYASTERIGDLTLGDSWGTSISVDQVKQGISLILCQSQKGKILLSNINIYLTNVDVQNAVRNNQQLREPPKKSEKKNIFFKRIKAGDSFNSIVMKCYPWICFKQMIKKILIKMRMYK